MLVRRSCLCFVCPLDLHTLSVVQNVFPTSLVTLSVFPFFDPGYHLSVCLMAALEHERRTRFGMLGHQCFISLNSWVSVGIYLNRRDQLVQLACHTDLLHESDYSMIVKYNVILSGKTSL